MTRLGAAYILIVDSGDVPRQGVDDNKYVHATMITRQYGLEQGAIAAD